MRGLRTRAGAATAYLGRLLQLRLLGRWRGEARALCAPRRVASEAGLTYHLKQLRRSLRVWAYNAFRATRNNQMERLLHAHTLIEALRADVVQAVNRDMWTQHNLQAAQQECHALREALATYEPSHRRATAASRGWAAPGELDACPTGHASRPGSPGGGASKRGAGRPAEGSASPSLQPLSSPRPEAKEASTPKSAIERRLGYTPPPNPRAGLGSR